MAERGATHLEEPERGATHLAELYVNILPFVLVAVPEVERLEEIVGFAPGRLRWALRPADGDRE